MDEQRDAFTAPHLDGPPPPPWERRRRSRRRVVLAVVMVLAVLGIGAALVLPGLRPGEGPADDSDPSSEPDAEGPTETDPGPDGGAGGDDPDATTPDDEELAHPDLDTLEGEDAVFGQLLVDIDASERVMIGFQDELQAAFSRFGLPGDDLLDRISAAAAAGSRGLLSVRERLDDRLEPADAEAVREVYVDHLDAWVRYMQAVEGEPTLVDPSVDSSRYILSINASAGVFARALEEHLPTDVDPAVRDLADGILDRGFRMETEPQV